MISSFIVCTGAAFLHGVHQPHENIIKGLKFCEAPALLHGKRPFLNIVSTMSKKKVDLKAEYFPWHGVIWIGVSE